MSNPSWIILTCIIAAVAVFAGTACFMVGLERGLAIGYKDGQVDALTDAVRYQLIKQDDGGVRWERVKTTERTRRD